jgi:hypothetical protein
VPALSKVIVLLIVQVVVIVVAVVPQKVQPPVKIKTALVLVVRLNQIRLYLSTDFASTSKLHLQVNLQRALAMSLQ